MPPLPFATLPAAGEERPPLMDQAMATLERAPEEPRQVRPRPAGSGLSVDVEDYYHAWAITSVIGKSGWLALPSRVEASTRRLLDLFEEKNVRSTFFVLGWVAERQPALVRDIVARGHELASHGYGHDKVFELTPAAFLEDIQRTKHLLEDQGGVAVQGYRAPSFSIDRRSWWAYEVLTEAGYVYSSSLHPIRHDHYGMPDAPLTPFRPDGGAILEIPVATIDVRGRRVSCAGGGHFRILPYRWSRWCFDRLDTDGDRAGIFYLHPWEIDPDQPRIGGLPLRSRFRHYTGQTRMETKLARLLDERSWDRIDHLFDFDAIPAGEAGWTALE